MHINVGGPVGELGGGLLKGGVVAGSVLLLVVSTPVLDGIMACEEHFVPSPFDKTAVDSAQVAGVERVEDEAAVRAEEDGVGLVSVPDGGFLVEAFRWERGVAVVGSGDSGWVWK